MTGLGGFLDVTGLTFPAHAGHCLGITSYRWLNAHRRRKDAYGSAMFRDYREMPCQGWYMGEGSI